jgi:hypothetical protein
MGRFYGRLPSELLDLTVDEFRLNFQVWYQYLLDQKSRENIRSLEARRDWGED